MPPATHSLLLHCRAGFENDCAAEITAAAAADGLHGYCRTRPDSALVEFSAADPATDLGPWLSHFPLRSLIFARQWHGVFARLEALPADDRVTPIVAAVKDSGVRFGAVHLEYPDTNEGRRLSRFCRGFASPLEQALRRQGLLKADPARPRLHLLFLDSSAVSIGWSDPANSSPWERGIARLRLLREAPSRSALKLEEAMAVLLDDTERERFVRPGMHAADLGAAPGGWSWFLARRGLHVTAVDHGALASGALATGMIDTVAADAFVWRPPTPVDWVVCDIVDKPARVVSLMGQWLQRGDCRHAMFNLKLPMKQRYPAAMEYLQRLRRQLGEDLLLRSKQLYHDREEITVYAALP